MDEWKNKLRFWKKDRQLARPTGATGSGEAPQGLPNRNPADRVAKEGSDATHSEESAFGIKALVPSEGASIE